MDYDLEATVAASERISGAVSRSLCGLCHKPMYKVPLFPGVPTEWRHASSGHAVSWTPEKHLAGLGVVSPHQHRFQGRERVRTCIVAGCDSQVIERRMEPRPVPDRTEREVKEQESRMRGNVRAQQTRRNTIPF